MLKNALKISCLLAISSAAVAWQTPQQAIDNYINFELNGGRLSSENYSEYENKYAHIPQDYEEGGWDSVIVVDSYSIGEPICKGKRCTSIVTFTLHPTEDLEGPPVVDNETGGIKKVKYTVLNKNGDWRIKPTGDYPIISLETYQKF